MTEVFVEQPLASPGSAYKLSFTLHSIMKKKNICRFGLYSKERRNQFRSHVTKLCTMLRTLDRALESLEMFISKEKASQKINIPYHSNHV